MTVSYTHLDVYKRQEPDEGTVTTANHIVINYLPQNPEFDPDETALEHVMSRVVTSQLDEDMRWSIESDAKSLLMKLDITDMAQKTGELSGCLLYTSHVRYL